MRAWHFLHVSSGIIGKRRHRSANVVEASSETAQSDSADSSNAPAKIGSTVEKPATQASDRFIVLGQRLGQ